MKQKSISLKRVLIIVLIALVGVALIALLTVYGIWHNEISTLTSFRQIRERNDAHNDGSVYMMEVSGGFYLDKFIEQGGAKSDAELIQFITDSITKGLIDMGLSESDIGCSSFTAVSESGDRLFGTK